MVAESVHRRVPPRSPADEPADARDVLPHGRPARPPLDPLPRGRGHRAERAAVHRLSRPPDEVRRVHEEGRAAARRPVRLLLQALPGYEEVGQRRVLLGCWGSFNDPEACDYKYPQMAGWGRAMYVTPGVDRDGELVTTDLVDINLGIRILLGLVLRRLAGGETFVKTDPLGNPIDQQHPWNQTTTPRPQKPISGQIHLGHVAALVRPAHGDYLWLDTGGGPIARLWVHGPGEPGGRGLRQGDRPQRQDLSEPESHGLRFSALRSILLSALYWCRNWIRGRTRGRANPLELVPRIKGWQNGHIQCVWDALHVN